MFPLLRFLLNKDNHFEVNVTKMHNSMAEYIKMLIPHLHADLVSAKALSNLQTLAQNLPPCSKTMLEFRLAGEPSQIDLSIFFFDCSSLNLSDKFLVDPVWRGLNYLSQEWVDPTSLLHQNIEYIALEFDLDKPPNQLQIPCIFLAFNRGSANNAKTVIDMVSKLPYYSASSKLNSNIQNCVDCLPKGAKIGFVGAMLSRPQKGLRVIVGGLPPDGFSDYLKQIGWSQATNTISTLVETLSSLVDEIRFLSFDIVGDIISPRVGLEFFFQNQPNCEPRWQVFLNCLVKMGLCSSRKKDAFLKLPGVSNKADNSKLWPESISWVDRLLGYQAVSVFWRTINHVKIVYCPSQPLEAKGYICFGHGWYNSHLLNKDSQQITDIDKV